VGPEAARRSRAIAFREGRLIVEVAGSVWMHHLAAVKRSLVSQVNLAIGEPAVEDIVFVLNPALAGPQTPRNIR
jgi:predicted nucleic acid-binding Zn ribbon protein